MAYEPRRTLLVGLSALAVVLTAALLPAAGIGTHPGGSVTVADDPPPAELTPATIVDETPTAPDSDEPSDETTPTPAPTPTATQAPPGSDAGDSPWLPDRSLASLLVGALKSIAAVTVGGAALVLVAALRGVEPGSPHVALPFGYSITLPFVLPASVGRLGTSVSRATMGFVIAISASVTQLFDAAVAALRAVTSGLGIVAGEGLRGTVALLGRLPGALARAVGALVGLPGGLLSLPSVLSTVGGGFAGDVDRAEEDVRTTAPPPETAEGDGRGPRSVQDAWVAMVGLLPGERDPATTPTEFARQAVARGAPAAPVRRVTRAFEDVVYGGYEPGDRVAAARESLRSLRERLGGDG